MASRKPSSRARRREAFEAGLEEMDLGGLFEREDARREEQAARREEALREKACLSKNRYATKAEAEAVRDLRTQQGAKNLSVYRCGYCKGWHLTHKGHLA